MKDRVYSFDLEQADPFPEDGQIEDYASLGITCASGLASDRLQEKPLVYYAGMYEDAFKPRMNIFEINEYIEHLLEMTKEGYRLLSWNGASYDFRMLAEAAPSYKDDLRKAMYNSIDMMFHFFCVQGYFLGLNKACIGQDIKGKIPDPVGDGQMNGQKAVEYWPEHAELVLAYVSNDALAPILLYNKIIEQDGIIYWTSNSGQPTSANLGPLLQDFRWLSVSECLELPLPDTGWMSKPVTRQEILAYW